MTTDPKSPSNKMGYAILVVVVAVALGLGFYFMVGSETGKDAIVAGMEDAVDNVTDTVAGVSNDMKAPEGFPPMPQAVEPASGDVITETPDSEEGFHQESEAPAFEDEVPVEAQEETTGLDVDAVLAERGFGDPNAPVRIDEFASLTCSHCASFHQNTFDELKAKYIDTGKVYFVFNDFPLDRAALDASITARCLPEERYGSFLSLLFKTQRSWATEGYIKALQQNAKLAGLSDAEFDACMESDKIKNGLEAKIKEAQGKYEVQSTPTFIINQGDDVIKGSSSIGTFDQVISKALGE